MGFINSRPDITESALERLLRDSCEVADSALSTTHYTSNYNQTHWTQQKTITKRLYIYGDVKGHRDAMFTAAVESLDGAKPNTKPKTDPNRNNNNNNNNNNEKIYIARP